MRKIILLSFVMFAGLFSLAFMPLVFAANWYVDNAVATSGNGQSWKTAWKAFSNINWASVQPGDTIYISGGTTSKTYTETLNVGKSGTSGNLITIRKGIESGHDGVVIIDRNFVSGYGLNIQGESFVTVRDLHVQNTGSNAVYLRNGKYIYLDNMEIRNANGQLIFLQGYTNEGAAWTVPALEYIYIRNCVIEDLRYAQYQTDLIAGYYAIQNLFIENNVLRVGNTNSAEHTDDIQFDHNVRNVTISGNWIENQGSVTGGIQNQGIMSSKAEGIYRIYNNVFYTPKYDDGVDPIYGAKSMNTLLLYQNHARTEIIGNTFITGDNSHLIWNTGTNVEMRNNIFYNLQQRTGTSIWMENGLNTWNEVSNNIFSDNTVPSNGDVYLLPQGAQSIPEIQAMYDGESNSIINNNPAFVDLNNENLKLQANSIGIDDGYVVGAPYNVDIDGVSRPQGSGYDIGAYEFVSGSTQYHPADTSQNGCIELGEISVYVGRWLNNQGVTLSEASSAVSTWMGGC